MQGVVPCIKSTLACSSDESKTARRHTTIFTAQWNVFSARARRGQSEHDLFHASDVESQVDLVLFSFDNGVSIRWASSEVPRLPTSYALLAYGRVQSQKRVGSTKIKVPGYMQVTSTDTEIFRLFCSSSRHSCRCRLLGPAGSFVHTRFVVAFSGRKPSAYFRSPASTLGLTPTNSVPT